MADGLNGVAQSPYTPQTAGGTTTQNANGALGKDDFMRLLVAQLSHQDPLAPSDPSQFVSQLSQFSSLEQLVNMKAGLDLLAITQTAGTSAQMVSFIGKSVEFDGAEMPWKKGSPPANVSWKIPSDAEEVTVTVRDSAGSAVRTEVLGPRNAGTYDYAFDGKKDGGAELPDGTYSVEITAKNANGDSLAVSQRSTGSVTGVTFANGYPQLILADGRTIGLAQVIQILEAGAAAAPPATAAPPAATTEPASSSAEEAPPAAPVPQVPHSGTPQSPF